MKVFNIRVALVLGALLAASIAMPSVHQATAQLLGNDGAASAAATAPVVNVVAPKGGGIIQMTAFGWLEPYVDSAVQALIAAGFAWFGKSRYSAMLDKDSRDALEVFVKNRASSLLADGAVSLRGKSVQVDNGLLYRAASESATAIPDALKRFNLSPEVVAQKIIDAIPQTTAGAAIVANAHAADDHAAPSLITDRPPSAPGMPPVSGAA